MTEAAKPPRTKTPGVLDRLLLFSGLLVVVAGVILAGRPIESLFPPERVVLDVTRAQPDSGPCFLLAHDLGVPSDRGGEHSSVQLYEDDTPLLPHATHQRMRDGELGRFSHWGKHIYLASTDGSDPRTNGRAYVAELPMVLASWLSQVLLATLIAGAALALLGFTLARVRKRSLVADLVPVLGAGALLWTTLPLDMWVPALRTLRTAERQLAGSSGLPLAHAATRPGNVTRLLATDSTPAFEAFTELPDSDGRVRVSLSPEPGVELHDGLARLEPGGPGLVGSFASPHPITSVGDVLLPARVVSGGVLELSLLRPAEGVEPLIQTELPVSAVDELRPLEILNPLSLYVGAAEARVGSISLRVPAHKSESVVVETTEVVVLSPATSFLQSTHGARALAIDTNLRPTTWQSVPGRFSIPLGSLAGELLKGSLGLFGRAPDTPVPWSVTWVDTQGSEHALLRGELSADDGWHEVATRLERAGAESRGGVLQLEVGKLPAGTAFGWSGWRLVDDSRSPRRVIVLLLDTLRRDALGVFGGTEAATPFLDGLARAGVRFDRAYSQAHWTRPSMPSLMTARYVAATGVENIGEQLPEHYTTLAEAFAEAGFATVADIANTNAGPNSGLAQGWDQMRHFITTTSDSTQEHLLDSDLLARIDQMREEDLVLYLHLMEAHGPYGPRKEPGDAEFGADAPPVARDDALDQPWVSTPTTASRRHWYYRDVERMDGALATFFGRLEELWGRPAMDHAILAMTSDHGEYLGEHGQWSHGWFQQMPEVINVPMFVRAPGLPTGRVVSTTVENIDLAPSLLALAELDAGAMGDVDGRSLLPLILQDDESSHGFALSGLGRERRRQLGLYADGHALLGSGGELVGRLKHDETWSWQDFGKPDRDTSVLDVQAQAHVGTQFGDLWAAYLESREAVREGLWANVEEATVAIDPLALKQLEELGYLGDD